MKATERALRQQQNNLITGLQGQIEMLNRRLSEGVDKQLLLINQVIRLEEELELVENGGVMHWNPPSDLPPVDCPLLIKLPSGTQVHAERTGFISDRDRDMEYRLSSGELILGRFMWTYP